MPVDQRFDCPICNAGRYERVQVRRGGGWYTTEFYRCVGCTAMFTDPARFTAISLGDGPAAVDRREPEGTEAERAAKRRRD